MKFIIRVFTALLLLTGAISLIRQTTANYGLAAEVSRLEAELGKISRKCNHFSCKGFVVLE